MNPHNLNHLRHLLESPELTKQRQLGGGISATTAGERREVLAQITGRLDGKSRNVLVRMREHVTPYLGLNDDPPDYLESQSRAMTEVLKILEECGLIVLEVGRHGCWRVGFTPTGFQVALSIR
jgi:hypothetical protein